MVFCTSREFIWERQALGRKKEWERIHFFGDSADRRKKIFAAEKKRKNYFFFFEKERGKNRPSERQKMLMLLLLDVGCWADVVVVVAAAVAAEGGGGGWWIDPPDRPQLGVGVVPRGPPTVRQRKKKKPGYATIQTPIGKKIRRSDPASSTFQRKKHSGLGRREHRSKCPS